MLPSPRVHRSEIKSEDQQNHKLELVLAGPTGDDTVASNGDLAEDGESVARNEIELRVS